MPFLLEVRDLWPAFAVEVGVLRNPLLIRASQWLERFLYRHADQIVVNSPGFVEHVHQHGGQNITVVPNGADSSMFDPADKGTAFRKQHGLHNKFVLLYAGAHGLSNDLGVVLKAAELLRQENKIAIVLLGGGKDKPALESEATAMGLDNLHFAPPISKAEMPGALAAADACLAILKPLKLYATVYPNKAFDYMAAGRPILLAIDGEIRKVVEAAQAGAFVPPGDAQALAQAIRKMAENPERAKRMGLAGRKYLEQHFERAALAAEMQAVIEAAATRKL